ASGLVVLLVNGANRFADGVMAADRAYEGVLRFGRTTDTGDAYGRETATGLAAPSDFSRFRGDIFQTEPRFCSVRREGSAGYEIADTGEHSPFLAHIYRLDVEADGKFRLKASKNLLVRALATEMGATLESLRRTVVGKFSVDSAVPFDRLLDTEIKDFPSCVMPASEALR
ncbi:MAG: hypothetical protein ILO34_01485, partial [Kiritimatiellae bacterium]|nr:hypothetical protein [Kiritimatiellia bacterium]